MKEKKNRSSNGVSGDVTGLCFPGVFKFECKPKKRAYFGKARSELIFEAQQFYSDLIHGVLENKQLKEDFLNYGTNNFEFDIIVVGSEYYDETKLNQALEKAKTDWLGELY